MKLSTQQAQAIDAVNKWKNTHHKVFVLTGSAGTGKTTIAKHLATENTIFAAFTGKAANVLTSKGCPASTLHSLLYRATLNETTGIWSFSLNHDSPIKLADMVILDEVSMVGTQLGEDLLKLARKVLVLGDSHQLPPIGETPFFVLSQPDFNLTEIHRQAADSPIIYLATLAREGERITPGTYGNCRVLKNREFTTEAIGLHDQVLVGRNNTRESLNRRYRKTFTDELRPLVSDKLIALANNRERGYLNGSLWKVVESIYDSDAVSLKVEDNSKLLNLLVFNEFFTGEEADLTWQKKRQCDNFTYGYAITTHKAQGSQWDKVLVVDESHVFKEDSKKWLYTAITRAAESVTIYV